MKYNLITILFLFFFLQPLFGQVTIELPTVADCGNTDNPIGLLSASQSTTQGNNPPERAIDGELNGTFSEEKASKTYTENNPYFQVTLEGQTVLTEVSIHYPSDLFPKGMGNYYILISDYPFENSNLSEKISSPTVEAIYVENPIASGTAIPLNNKSGRFVQIQLDGFGFISLTEIELLGIEPGNGGGVEICGNGEDDDCDGRIDCEDNDCAPVIAHVTKVEPTCPTCEDGQIRVNAANKRESEVLFSLDGGANFVEFNRAEEYSPVHLFDNLGEGAYDLVVKNDICEVVYQNNSITLSATTGILTSDCGNGDFEMGDEHWTLERYSVETDDLISRKENDVNASFNVDRIEAFILPTAGFVDPIVPEINGGWSALGEYILKLGAQGATTNPFPNAGQDDRNIAKYCFTVNEENQDFSFIYAPVLQDAHDDDDQRPFFQYQLFIDGESDEGRTIYSNDGFFDEGPNGVKYKSWTCAFFDLSEHIGSVVCVHFTVQDCTEGGHFGYVYIDGLCTDANLLNPEIEILADEVYCSDESVSLNVIGGGYSSFQWKVGKVDNNGNQYDVFEFPLVELGYDASFPNVLPWYAANSGFSDDCSMYFAELSVFGDCGTTTESIQFRKSCVDNVVDYCDYLLACTTHDEFTFQGEVDCEGCIFDWQPAYYFVDNTVALPTVRADEISGTNDAFDREYYLTYTAPDGCDDTRTVTVGGDDFDVVINETYDLCYSTYLITVNFDFDVVPEVVENLFAIDPENNFYHEFQGEYVSSTNRSITYKIEIDRSILYGVRPITRAYYYIDFDFSVLDDVCLLDENETLCWKEGWLEEYSTNVFSKPWVIDIPNVMAPFASDLTLRTFRPHFGYLEDPNDCESLSYEASSIIYAKLTVEARNERIVWIQEATVMPGATEGLTGEEIEWDGIQRCQSNFNCGSGYGCSEDGSDDRCRDLSYPIGSNDDDPSIWQYHEAIDYKYILEIVSCTKELVPCGYLCDDGDEFSTEHCPDGENNYRVFEGFFQLYY